MGTTLPAASTLPRLMRRVLLIAVALTTLIILPACATQTPVTTLRDRGDQHFERGEFHEAAREYAAIVDRYPGDWYAQMRLGQSFIETGDYGPAAHALRIAQATRPDYPEIDDSLAEAMQRSGNKDMLITELNDRIASGGDVNDHLRLARFALLNDDPDSARRAIEQAIALDDGRHVEPLLAAADLARKVGDREELLMRLQQAYNVNPRDPRVLDSLRELGEVPGPTLAMPTER